MMRVKFSVAFGQHGVEAPLLGSLSLFSEPHDDAVIAASIDKLTTIYNGIAALLFDDVDETVTIEAVTEPEVTLDDSPVWHVFFAQPVCCLDRAKAFCALFMRVTRYFFEFVAQLGIDKTPTDLHHYGIVADDTNENTRH